MHPHMYMYIELTTVVGTQEKWTGETFYFNNSICPE